MRRHPVLSGAVAVLVVVAGVVAAGAFSVPATALSVDGVSISRATLDSDLSTIQQNAAFGCYLDASVELRSDDSTGLPPIGGTGRSGTYNTDFVDFWLSEQVNNLLIEGLAARQHLALDATAISAGHADLTNAISTILASAAESTGQSAVCASSGQALLSTLPSGLVDALVHAQAAGDLVLAHAAGYGLGTAQLTRYFDAHQDQFQTICLSVIETASQATAAGVRSQIEGGESFAAAAVADSTDTTSAADGGSVGCISANEAAYESVADDVIGLGVGAISQPIDDNGSYLLLQVNSYQPAVFDAVVPAVRGAVLDAGSTRASKELAALTKTAQVNIDPRYGRWSGSSGVGIEPPRSPATANLLAPEA